MFVFILLPLPFQKGKEKNLVSCKKQALQKGKEITPFLSSPPRKNSFEEEFLVFQKFHLWFIILSIQPTFIMCLYIHPWKYK